MRACGLPRAAGGEASARRLRRPAVAQRGRGDPRQVESFRVGEFPLDAIDQRLERARRPHAQSVRARSQHQRVVVGIGSGDRRQPCGRRGRYRDGRIDHLPRVGERAGRHQAHGRGEAKQELGMDQYQVRGYCAWHKHMALVMMAQLFVQQEKVLANPKEVEVTTQDIVVVIKFLILPPKKLEQVIHQIRTKNKTVLAKIRYLTK